MMCDSGAIPAYNPDTQESLELYVGIIDVLQSYRFAKKFEHTFKSLVQDAVRFVCSSFDTLVVTTLDFVCHLFTAMAPSRMVGVSASVDLPLHHKVQTFCSGTGSPRWSQKKYRKMVVMVVMGEETLISCPLRLCAFILRQLLQTRHTVSANTR